MTMLKYSFIDGSFSKKIDKIFVGSVVVPTTVAAIYFLLFASNVYISESRFVVRSPDKPSSSGFGILLKTAGFSNSGDEIYAAQDFVESRDALRAINTDSAFEKSYSNQKISIFNRFNGFGFDGSFEELYKYYSDKVKITENSSTSITTLTVRAYDPIDAVRFNTKLLELSEAMVNKMSVRGRRDLIDFAQREVSDAKAKASASAIALSAYRNQAGIIDPDRQATVQMQMISKLQDELISTRMRLVQLKSFTPKNPQISVLSSQVNSLKAEIDQELSKVAGGRKSLSSAAVKYQELVLENQFSEKQLASAMAALTEAQNEARRKQAYVERIVEPNLPDDYLEPKRLRGIISVFVFGLVAWAVLKMLIAGIREHQD